jgi:hypothetical protein
MKYDLGFFDQELGTVTSAENPFGAKVLPICPERTKILWRARTDSNRRPLRSKRSALSS